MTLYRVKQVSISLCMCMLVGMQEPAVRERGRPGRKLDRSRDAQLLECALDVLAESGYEGMTIDAVAARAGAARATVYRRWPTKAELVLEAVIHAAMPVPEVIPDTGSLIGDFAALTSDEARAANARMMKVVSGLLTTLTDSPELTKAVHDLTNPRITVMRIMLERAEQRGEIPAGRNLDVLANVVPALIAWRSIMLREPADAAFVRQVLDDVLLPAAGVRRPGEA
jgi:AcrR family transcriptional regulator